MPARIVGESVVHEYVLAMPREDHHQTSLFWFGLINLLDLCTDPNQSTFTSVMANSSLNTQTHFGLQSRPFRGRFTNNDLDSFTPHHIRTRVWMMVSGLHIACIGFGAIAKHARLCIGGVMRKPQPLCKLFQIAFDHYSSCPRSLSHHVCGNRVGTNAHMLGLIGNGFCVASLRLLCLE
jgi:hypothetical protein